MQDWKSVRLEGVGLEECRIGRVLDWKSVGLEECKIGRVYDQKRERLEDCEKDCENA